MRLTENITKEERIFSYLLQTNLFYFIFNLYSVDEVPKENWFLTQFTGVNVISHE